MQSDALPDWQRAGGPPACSGRLRVAVDDFRVTELLELDFSGAGEHDWLWVEKRGANTAWVAQQLARQAGVPLRDVGYAGLKDRHAVTRQWFSVRRAGGAALDWSAVELPDTRVLDTARHARKLRRGAHRGNRFELRVRNLAGDPRPALARIARDGVPNYFGEQRFGRGGRNIDLAARLFAGRRLRREQRSIALSAARALLFNDVLDRRVRDGSWQTLVAGDVAMLDGSNSHFAVTEVDATLIERCRRFDVHPSGPLWGRGGDSQARCRAERAAPDVYPDLAAGLERYCDSARRPLRARVADLDVAIEQDTLTLSFELAAGVYATAVLREVADYVDASLAAVPQ